jgi:hypothetical protein
MATSVPYINVANSPRVGLRVVASCVTFKFIGAHILTTNASEVGFFTTYHVACNVDSQCSFRRVDILCSLGGRLRSTSNVANPTVNLFVGTL